jgi:hypothetical protein
MKGWSFNVDDVVAVIPRLGCWEREHLGGNGERYIVVGAEQPPLNTEGRPERVHPDHLRKDEFLSAAFKTKKAWAAPRSSFKDAKLFSKSSS